MTTSALDRVNFRFKPFLACWIGLTLLNTAAILYWEYKTQSFACDVLWIPLALLSIMILASAIPSLLISILVCGVTAAGLDIARGRLSPWHVIGGLAVVCTGLLAFWKVPWIFDALEITVLACCAIAYLAKRMLT